jgi:hypothetical protein
VDRLIQVNKMCLPVIKLKNSQIKSTTQKLKLLTKMGSRFEIIEDQIKPYYEKQDVLVDGVLYSFFSIKYNRYFHNLIIIVLFI